LMNKGLRRFGVFYLRELSCKGENLRLDE
jgi:hypothetical protein